MYNQGQGQGQRFWWRDEDLTDEVDFLDGGVRFLTVFFFVQPLVKAKVIARVKVKDKVKVQVNVNRWMKI